MAQQKGTPLHEVRRLPSHADLMKCQTKRPWTPMELILARAFLKEADLVLTSTKKGAVIKEGSVMIDELPEMISNSVLPATHAKFYCTKERKKKDPSDPTPEKKEPRKKKAKLQPPMAIPQVTPIAPIVPLSSLNHHFATIDAHDPTPY